MIAKLIADKDCCGMFTELNKLPASSRTKVSFVPTAIDPANKNLVCEIVYEESRRYIKERRDGEGIRLTVSLQRSGIFGTDILTQLAKIDLNSRFKEYGWVEPIYINPAKPEIVINFSEDKIKDDPTYLNHFFETIAHTCFERFRSTIEDLGFNRGFKEATALLLPTALHNVDSPYVLAAKFCSEQDRIIEARYLLSLVSSTHWQKSEAVEQQAELYELELRELRAEIRALKLNLHNLGVSENTRENVKAAANAHAKPGLLTDYIRSCERSQASRFADVNAYFADPKPSKWRM